jgi:hypothetical protein
MTSSGEVGRTRRAEPPWKSVVERSAPQYFRDQAERILALAKRCSDPAIRSELTTLAAEWVEQAKTVSNSGKGR